jgi:hypothetical protein
MKEKDIEVKMKIDLAAGRIHSAAKENAGKATR